MLDDYYLNLLDWGGNQLAVALGCSVYLWNAETGDSAELLQMTNPENVITSLRWAKDSNHLAVGTNEGEVQLWDVEKRKQVRSMQGHMARVGSLSWNGHILASGSRDTSIFLHDVRLQQHHTTTFQHHTQEVCGLEWSPNGFQLASGGNDNVLAIWEPSTSTVAPKFSFEHHTAAVKAIAWCPWQVHFATCVCFTQFLF